MVPRRGELEIAHRLTALGPAWRVLHSVPVGRGTSDIDHVVIGPPGVFTINTKHHEGRDIWLSAKRLLVNGQPTDHLRNARFEAKRASQRMSVAMHAFVDVAPIVAIVGARRITVRERPTTVFVMRERELVAWLSALPAVVPPADVARLADRYGDVGEMAKNYTTVTAPMLYSPPSDPCINVKIIVSSGPWSNSYNDPAPIYTIC